MHLQRNATDMSMDYSAKHDSSHQLAVVAFGNSLRGDDGVASHLIEKLHSRLGSICTLDAGNHTSALPAFLHKHKTGIIIDSARGTNDEMVKFDLSHLNQAQIASIDCSHALSWLDEIILYQKQFPFPEKLFFIAVPTYESAWQIGLSERLRERLSDLEAELYKMIEVEIATNA